MMPTPPNSTKGQRQPCHATSLKTSGVVAAAPRKLPTNVKLRARPWCEEGNQQEMLRAMFGKARASPTPNMKRTSSSDAKPAETLVSAVKTDHQMTMRASALRVPK